MESIYVSEALGAVATMPPYIEDGIISQKHGTDHEK